MESKVRNAIAMALSGMLCMACAVSVAKEKKAVARYPVELHGVWLGGDPERCKSPDSLDSDVRFEVAPTKLTGYEHWNEPLRVIQISKSPLAWKVVSRLHVYEDASNLEEIFVLNGRANKHLTVINSDQSTTYWRCQ